VNVNPQDYTADPAWNTATSLRRIADTLEALAPIIEKWATPVTWIVGEPPWGFCPKCHRPLRRDRGRDTPVGDILICEKCLHVVSLPAEEKP
jgi:hypothetical protein